MGHDFVIGCVGKPSAGKSTFFNAISDNASAKVGNYPFTTIEANQGVAYTTVTCPCTRFNVKCKPHYGSCKNAERRVPVKVLDVAGLIPGASEGLGLGNKFLDDLRHADVLLHIVDVSGTTNEKGDTTVDYDPSNDHEWLQREIMLWIFNNLWSRWGSIARRHKATNSTPVATLLGQLSGYGAREQLIGEVLDEMGVKVPVDFSTWDKEEVNKLVEVFVHKRFQFILVLNKADMGGNSDRNSLKLLQSYGEGRTVLCSALAECFLRKMKAQNYIRYVEGDMFFTTAYDEENDNQTASSPPLKTPDPKLKARLEKIRDMVLFRHGSTGVYQAIQKAVKVAGLVPAFPVKNIQRLLLAQAGPACGDGGAVVGGAGPLESRSRSDGAPFFPECILLRRGTTVRKFAKMLHDEIDRNFSYAEGADGQRLGEDEEITEINNIIRYVTDRIEYNS